MKQWKSYIVTTPKASTDEIICSELDTVCNMLAEQGFIIQSVTSHGRRLIVLASHAEQSDDDGLGADRCPEWNGRRRLFQLLRNKRFKVFSRQKRRQIVDLPELDHELEDA